MQAAERDAQPTVDSAGPSPVVSQRVLGWVMVITSALGLLASVELTLERSKQLADPDYIPACDVNALISCGTVMKTPEAAIFGFSNSWLGIASFIIMAGVGVWMLMGRSLPTWAWWGVLAGQVGGLLMVHFLMWTSMVELQTLCPWCVLTWFATIPQAVVVFAYATSSTALGWSAERRSKAAAIGAYYPVVLLGWLGLIAVGIALEFFINTP